MASFLKSVGKMLGDPSSGRVKKKDQGFKQPKDELAKIGNTRLGKHENFSKTEGNSLLDKVFPKREKPAAPVPPGGGMY